MPAQPAQITGPLPPAAPAHLRGHHAGAVTRSIDLGGEKAFRKVNSVEDLERVLMDAQMALDEANVPPGRAIELPDHAITRGVGDHFAGFEIRRTPCEYSDSFACIALTGHAGTRTNVVTMHPGAEIRIVFTPEGG